VELNPDELLLAQNKRGKTAWQMAVMEIYVEILQKM
jgi:hypothetical protein